MSLRTSLRRRPAFGGFVVGALAPVIALGAASVGGCLAPGDSPYGPDDTPPPVDPGPQRVPADVQEIFNASCAFGFCHGGEAKAAGISLEEAEAYAIVGRDGAGRCAGKKLVEAGRPDESCLYVVTTTGQMPPGSGLGGGDQAVLRRWIEAGAPARTGDDGAGGAGGAGGSGGASAFSDVQAIFTGSCLGGGCHSGGSPAAGLSLEEGRARAELVDQRTVAYCRPDGVLVVPGDPDASCLQTLVDADTMPLARPALTQEQKDLLRAWITAGAAP